MAVSAMPLNSTLIVKYQTGVTSTGDPELKQKSLNYLRADASEQDIYAMAEALFSLSQNPVTNVFLRKNYELIDE